uniref:MMS19 nucleotide excision repair protein n=1 Tax=Esox lucius TaxID=8010 RepID=A0A6Q2YIR6_ESOLU
MTVFLIISFCFTARTFHACSLPFELKLFMMAADSAILVGLVEEFVSGQQDSKAADTATGSCQTLHLTSSQPQTRARGVQLLSSVLQTCHGDLTEGEVVVLLAFYENRLKDHYVITPHVLQGLKALTKCSVLPPGSAVSILKSLFQDVHVQSLMLAERSCVYNILIQLMESKESELKGLGADFVFGFVQSVDGERDPRNLLLAFQIARKIIRGGYDLGKFTEELFEVTSCYFPIDFSPPPNDPHGITQEELILALRAVLTGTPCFAEFLLPLIIEKLDSDIQSAKLDSLQTLSACASVYEHKELAEFLPGLWASLRREVFQTASEKVESAGLAALTALTACLSRSVLSSDSEDSLNVFLDLVLKDCKHHLCEPDLKLVWPSAKLLQACSSASYRASHKVTAAVMPSLIEQYNSRTQVSSNDSVLLDFSQSLCSIVFSALSESNAGLQITSMHVLTALGQQTGEAPHPSTRSPSTSSPTNTFPPAANTVLATLMVTVEPAPLLVSESLAQADGAAASQEHSQQALHQRCVTALAAVSSHPSVVQETTPVLIQVLTSAHTGTGSFSLEEVIAVCLSLQRIAGQAEDTEENGQVFHDIIIPRLLGLALQAALNGENILIMCPGQVEIPQVDRLLLELEELSCTCDHPLSYTSAAKCYAGLVNKWHVGESSGLASASSSVRTQAFTLLLWVRPPLVTCPLSSIPVSQLFSLLSDPELGSLAADGFSLLMSDSTDILNRGCHADVRIMYRQRFFTENSSKLVQGFNTAPQERKSCYLKALSHILTNLPRQVQITELPALLPLLLEALSCPDQGVQQSTLSCLQPVLLDPPSALITQLEALVGRMLSLITSPSMVRIICAYHWLYQPIHIPFWPFTNPPFPWQIMPFRARVLRALATPLDDRKRMVRSEAVLARNEWFLLGSPGGR